MSDAVEIAPETAGLRQLRAIFEDGGGAPIGRLLGFSPEELSVGRVVFRGEPNEDVYNPIGMVHGGYAATLLDSACGCAVHSLLDEGQRYTTLELKVAYHKPMTAKTGVIRAEGSVVSLGRRAAFAEARITDAAGRLYATATSTLMIFSN